MTGSMPCLVHRRPADVPAVQGQAHALGIERDDVVPHCLEHIAIQLVYPRRCRQQIRQSYDLMATLLAQQHVVARVLATAAHAQEVLYE